MLQNNLCSESKIMHELEVLVSFIVYKYKNSFTLISNGAYIIDNEKIY